MCAWKREGPAAHVAGTGELEKLQPQRKFSTSIRSLKVSSNRMQSARKGAEPARGRFRSF